MLKTDGDLAGDDLVHALEQAAVALLYGLVEGELYDPAEGRDGGRELSGVCVLNISADQSSQCKASTHS